MLCCVFVVFFSVPGIPIVVVVAIAGVVENEDGGVRGDGGSGETGSELARMENSSGFDKLVA